MNYKDFKNKHLGSKIIVSGCGVSAAEIKNPSDHLIIGVNDIGRLYQPNYLVVLNDKPSFTEGRWEWIQNTQAERVFTHIQTLPIKEKNKLVTFQLGKYGHVDFQKDQPDYTSNSTYVACIIAAYMGAQRIGLIGCDFTPHHFFGQTGEHVLAKKLNNIDQEFHMLNEAFKRQGIEFFNLSPVSKLKRIPKICLRDF